MSPAPGGGQPHLASSGLLAASKCLPASLLRAFTTLLWITFVWVSFSLRGCARGKGRPLLHQLQVVQQAYSKCRGMTAH